jgi:hypothetical protein
MRTQHAQDCLAAQVFVIGGKLRADGRGQALSGLHSAGLPGGLGTRRRRAGSVRRVRPAAERFVFGRPDILSSSAGSHSSTVATLAIISSPG